MCARLPLALALIFLSMLAILPAAEPPGTADANEIALLKADNDFCKLCADKGMKESFVTYAAEDATMLVAGMDPIKGKEAIGNLFEAMDGVELTWHPLKAEAASSGDFGYTYGTFKMSSPGPDGKTRVRTGKYTTVWKKGSDGTWKYVLDVGNQDPVPAATQ